MINRIVDHLIFRIQKFPFLVQWLSLRRIKEKSALFQKIYFDWKTMPQTVAIELLADCNRACPYCQRFWTSRAVEAMPISTYEKIISDLHDIRFKGTLIFSPWSEPLLDKRLAECVRKAKSRLPKISVALVTNGDLLSLETFKRLTAAGVDAFDVSDHFSVSGNRYVIDNPKQAIETYLKLDNASREKIHFHDLNYKRIRRIDYFHNRSGTVLLVNTISHQNLYKKCFLPEQSVTIDPQGRVVLCCRQWLASPVFGDINESHIKAIWNNSEFKAIRKNLRKGIYDLPLCNVCGFGHLPEPARLEEMKKASVQKEPSS